MRYNLWHTSGKNQKRKTKGLGFESYDFALEFLDGLFLFNFILGIANKEHQRSYSEQKQTPYI